LIRKPFRFFREIGRADELGSGVRKLMKYGKAYGGSDPELIEGDVFRSIVKYPDSAIYEKDLTDTPEVTPEVTPHVAPQVTPQVERLLRVVKGEVDRDALQQAVGLKARKNFRQLYLAPAIDAGLIEMTIPDKPRSSKQKYRLTGKGRKVLKGIEGGSE
jgi:ATP-dependent DNA helicase RecG